MRIWTAHLRPNAGPVLVREGFSLGALVFGPVWFALHRAWIPAVFDLAAWIVFGLLMPAPLRDPLMLGLALLQGFSGHDLRRWSLERRGFILAQVVTARGIDDALERLLNRRPDLTERVARAELAR